MRKLLVIVFLLGAGVALGAQSVLKFNQFVTSLPLATTPLAGTEPTVVVQNGISKQVAVNKLTSGSGINSISGVAPGNAGQVATYFSTGSVVAGGSAGSLAYQATGGNTNRTGSDRANDKGINIVDFGADPTGSADSTAAIQSAIDFLNGTVKRTVFCADGVYKTTYPIFLDPPGNLRGADGTNGGTWSSGNAYHVNDTVNFSGIPYISLTNSNSNNEPDLSPANWQQFNWNSGTTYAQNAIVRFSGIPWISLSNGNTNNTPSTSSTFWRATWVNVQIEVGNFSYTFTGNLGMGSGNNNMGCTLKPTFANAVWFIMGPGQGQILANAQFYGQVSGYRGNFDPNGVAVCIMGGGPGAQRTTIENVEVDGIYTVFETGCNGDGLGAENTFRRVTATNCFQGIVISGSQNDINSVEEGATGCTNSYTAIDGPGISFHDNNLSTPTSVSALITMTTVSSLTRAVVNNISQYTLTSTIVPDSNITSCATNVANCIYNSWVINTPWFGPVPLTVTGYNSSSKIVTFQIFPAWSNYFYPGQDLSTTATDLQTEIQAATFAYAVERNTIFTGNSFHAHNAHVETIFGCTQFIDDLSTFSGDHGSSFDGIRVNNAIGGDNFVAGGPATANYGFALCQQSFPWMFMETGSSSIKFTASHFTQNSLSVIIDAFGGGNGSGNQCVFDVQGTPLFNALVRTNSHGGTPYGWPGVGGCSWQSASVNPSVFGSFTGFGYVDVPFLGVAPQFREHPNLSSANYTTLQSITSTNALGSYPLLYGGALYYVSDNNSPTAGKLVESLHQSWSYGQNLTTSGIAGLSWTYKGQSCVVLANSNAFNVIFPGLGITLNNGGGPQHYIVTSVVPTISLDGGTHAGYFTIVIPGSSVFGNSCGLGTATTVFTGTTIGQDAYSFKTLTLQ